MKAVIFDFDGTIADSFLTAVEVFYELTHRQPLPPEDISRLRDLKPRQLARELRIPMWRVPILLGRGRRLMRRRMNRIALVDGMDKAVRELHGEYKLFILSSNSSENVQAFLQRYRLDECFLEIYGSIGLFAKARRLRQIIHANDLVARDTWYIGDEARDIEAAHRAGLKAMAVSWGFNNIRVLRDHHPEALVFDADELVRGIKNNG